MDPGDFPTVQHPLLVSLSPTTRRAEPIRLVDVGTRPSDRGEDDSQTRVSALVFVGRGGGSRSSRDLRGREGCVEVEVEDP